MSLYFPTGLTEALRVGGDQKGIAELLAQQKERHRAASAAAGLALLDLLPTGERIPKADR
jgi:hypothetical protein